MFTSEDFNKHPPSSSYIKSCDAYIKVTDMDFQGGVAGAIADTFEASLRGYVEDEIEKTVCAELDSFGTEDLLEDVADVLDTWVDHVPDDPLAAENNLNVPDGVALINFSDSNTSIGNAFDFLLEQANDYLGGYDDQDLGINLALQTYLLDENGIYSIDIGDLGFEEDGLIYDGSDMISETKIWVTDVRIYGLDSFVQFEPLHAVGSQTLKSAFEIKNLTFKVDLKLEIAASSDSDIIIVEPGTPPVTEEITVDISVVSD